MATGNSLSGAQAKSRSISFDFPSTFTIERKVAPFVTVSQLKGHLKLLRAFDELRSSLNSNELPSFIDSGSDEEKWAWLVGFAVERFFDWCSALKEIDVPNDIKEFLPPIDVVMVWHAYMLNPTRYHDDSTRLHVSHPFFRLSTNLRKLIESEVELSLADVNRIRSNRWTCLTDRPFNLFKDAKDKIFKKVKCPHCPADFPTTLFVAYLDEDQKGYLQSNFKSHCHRCDTPFTRNELQLRINQDKDAVITSDRRSLISSVLRQRIFTLRILGVAANFSDDSKVEEVFYQYAIARYHAFLNLHSLHTESIFAPTLDIDLAWHTHQLLGSAYAEDMTQYIGRIIDHGKLVNEAVCLKIYFHTCEAWMNMFKVKYVHCGCPSPKENKSSSAILGSMAKLVTHGSLSSLACPLPHLVPPIKDIGFLAATHLSDHDLVIDRSAVFGEQKDLRRQTSSKKMSCTYGLPFLNRASLSSESLGSNGSSTNHNGGRDQKEEENGNSESPTDQKSKSEASTSAANISELSGQSHLVSPSDQVEEIELSVGECSSNVERSK